MLHPTQLALNHTCLVNASRFHVIVEPYLAVRGTHHVSARRCLSEVAIHPNPYAQGVQNNDDVHMNMDLMIAY